VNSQFTDNFKFSFEAIYETTPKNSGMRSGRFLEPSRIAKPASDRNYPEYYSIPDFCIGAELTGRFYFLGYIKIVQSICKSIRHHGSGFTREKLGSGKRHVASIFIRSKHSGFLDFYTLNTVSIINYIFVQKEIS